MIGLPTPWYLEHCLIWGLWRDFCSTIWSIKHHSHSRVSMMVADGLASRHLQQSRWLWSFRHLIAVNEEIVPMPLRHHVRSPQYNVFICSLDIDSLLTGSNVFLYHQLVYRLEPRQIGYSTRIQPVSHTWSELSYLSKIPWRSITPNNQLSTCLPRTTVQMFKHSCLVPFY